MSATKLVIRKRDSEAAQLRKLAQGRDALDIAQLQFVGFEEIRKAYGDRWPQQKEQIRSVAESFLRRRLAAEDLLIRAGEGFVVVFAAAVGADAEAAAAQLLHDLNAFYLGGDGTLPTPRVACATHTVPVGQIAALLDDAFLVTGEAAQAAPAEMRLASVDWRFQPVWDAKRETLSSWYAAPYIRHSQRRFPGYQFEAESAWTPAFATFDECGLEVSEKAIKELLSFNKQALVGTSIHARTLTNQAARLRIIAALDRLDRQLLRYRVMKIAGVTPGFPRLYLNEIVQILKARSDKVVIGAVWDDPDMAGFLQCGAIAVGVTLPPSVLGPAARFSMQMLSAKLAQDVRRAHGAGVRFFVEGDISAPIAMKLRDIGVDSIASSQIWPATNRPDAMQKWPSALIEERCAS